MSPTRDHAEPATEREVSSAEPGGPCLVIGYDGSDGARAAISWAAKVLPANGRLVLVHACSPLHGPHSPLSTAEDRRSYGRALIDELVLEGEDALLELQFGAEVVDEGPVTALTQAAERFGAAGIVVGTARHSRVRRAIGTVTSELLLASPVPVVAVPPRATAR